MFHICVSEETRILLPHFFLIKKNKQKREKFNIGVHRLEVRVGRKKKRPSNVLEKYCGEAHCS